MTLRDPKDITTMADLRVQIDALDHDLIRLLAVRQSHVDRAAQLKPNEGLPARIESRVDAVVNNVRAKAEIAGFDVPTAAAMWQLMIESMIAREDQIMSKGDTK